MFYLCMMCVLCNYDKYEVWRGSLVSPIPFVPFFGIFDLLFIIFIVRSIFPLIYSIFKKCFSPLLSLFFKFSNILNYIGFIDVTMLHVMRKWSLFIIDIYISSNVLSFCSFCWAPDRHPRANPGAGRSWDSVLGLSNLCDESPVSRHRRPPSSQGNGGTGQYITKRLTQLFISQSFVVVVLL